MGYLVRDHRSTCDPTGTLDGKLEEWDTVPCCHCNRPIPILLRGVTRKIAADHCCSKCRKPLCRDCGAVLARTGTCPGPVLKQIEDALKGQVAHQSITLAMRS